MSESSEGTRITETRGDGTLWVYTIDANGTKVGSMVGTEQEYYRQRGYSYNAQTGRWEAP